MARGDLVREIERGYILRFLAEIGFKPATPETLRIMLDDNALSVDVKQLDFHLSYLASKGFVELERNGGGKILYAKITASGIDLIDKRAKGDAGVRL